MKKVLCGIFVAMMSLFSTVSLSVLTAEPTYAEIKFEDDFKLEAQACEHSILGLRPWYAGLVGRKDGSSTCVVGTPIEDDLPLFVWTIVLNILADAMIVAGYVSLGFVIYGGYEYIMSAGEPSKVARGKKTLISAAIGLIISILATTIVNIIISVLAGAAK